VVPGEIVVDGRGLQGICYGDSGSALIDLDLQGNPVALAVESWGDDSCVGIDHMARLDEVYSWIAPVLAGEIPEDPCEGVTTEGECLGEVARWCRDATLNQLDCAALDSNCEYIDEARRHGCVCGDLDDVGRCNGNLLESCRRDRISVQDCAARGESCGWDGVEGRYACVDGTACRPEDEVGRCDGSIAINCAGGRTSRDLCQLDGRSCVQSTAGAICVAVIADAGVDASAVAADAGGGKSTEKGGCGCASAMPPGLVSVAGVLAATTLLCCVRRRRRL
jgi:hypothetical protein